VPIHKEFYDEITIYPDDIIRKFDKKEAKEVIQGLLKRFPDILKDIVNPKIDFGEKLYPKEFKHSLKLKYQEENKSLENFIKSN